MLKRTSLFNEHKKHGALFGEFGGYEMPLWLKNGAKNEHFAVLLRAGIFDTSHMSTLLLKGKKSRDLLQYLTAKDLDRAIGKDKKPLSDNQSVYSVYLNENGHVIDDTIIFQFDKNSYISVVNASMGEKIIQHINNFNNENIKIIDYTDKIGKIDLQGVLSVKALYNLLKDPSFLHDMRYFTFKGSFNEDTSNGNNVLTKNGYPVLISRTGYTGEIGFEIFVDIKYVEDLWESLLNNTNLEILPCGLAARDSLRTGAMLPLSHQDIGNWPFLNNPWTFVLPFDESKKTFTKKFLGDYALLNSNYREYTYPFLGFDLRKVPSNGGSIVLDNKGDQIGVTLTCVTEPSIDRYNDRIYCINDSQKPENLNIRGLSCGFVKVNKILKIGDKINLSDGKRVIQTEVVNTIRPNLTARKAISNFL
jgi:aminomethyltransferase